MCRCGATFPVTLNRIGCLLDQMIKPQPQKLYLVLVLVLVLILASNVILYIRRSKRDAAQEEKVNSLAKQIEAQSKSVQALAGQAEAKRKKEMEAAKSQPPSAPAAPAPPTAPAQ